MVTLNRRQIFQVVCRLYRMSYFEHISYLHDFSIRSENDILYIVRPIQYDIIDED